MMTYMSMRISTANAVGDHDSFAEAAGALMEHAKQFPADAEDIVILEVDERGFVTESWTVDDLS